MSKRKNPMPAVEYFKAVRAYLATLEQLGGRTSRPNLKLTQGAPPEPRDETKEGT